MDPTSNAISRALARGLLGAGLVLPAQAAWGCEYPDEGNLPLRRAVAKVRYLPEIEAWASTMRRQGAVVQYALQLDAPLDREKGCYWLVEVRADGQLWRRFYVSPDGERLAPAAPRAARKP